MTGAALAREDLAREDLERALPDADLRVLLMVLYHFTGDARWLEPPFTPGRDINLIADEDAGLPGDVQDEIRAAALSVLTTNTAPVVNDPGDDLMVRMMSACLGENVRPEYALMMREEMGFASRFATWSADAPPQPDSPVIIAGAGASGLAMAANLKALGLPCIIIEAREEVGGTWFANRYPGCAVDTPNHAYSFSFGARHPWTRYFSGRDDLLDYMVASSHGFGVRENIRFRTRVTAARWDEARHRWQVDIDGPDGVETLEGWALVSAIGPIAEPRLPDIAGMDDFNGTICHSARWPEGLDLTGKRVGVIGTGASAMQIVPATAPVAEHLTVFQRTAQWVRHIPRFHEEMTPGAQWLLAHVPFYVAWFRFTMLWRYGDGLLRTLRRDPDWPHPDRAMNRINDRHRVQMTEHIEAELKDRPDLLAKCVPDYPAYAKRILLDNTWYKTLRRENVDLVTAPIQRITTDGIENADGSCHDLDVIVLATGFDVFENAARLNITGRGGQILAEIWAGDPKAYLGITAPGFPNLFCLQGPNTVLAHGGSAIFTTECQVRYVAGCLAAMREQGVAAMDVREDVHDAYMAQVDAEHRELVWAHPGVTPWYRNAKGRVAAAIPWRLVDYRAMTDAPDLAEYHLTRAAEMS